MFFSEDTEEEDLTDFLDFKTKAALKAVGSTVHRNAEIRQNNKDGSTL